jgi:hypothetical protein
MISSISFTASSSEDLYSPDGSKTWSELTTGIFGDNSKEPACTHNVIASLTEDSPTLLLRIYDRTFVPPLILLEGFSVRWHLGSSGLIQQFSGFLVEPPNYVHLHRPFYLVACACKGEVIFKGKHSGCCIKFYSIFSVLVPK